MVPTHTPRALDLEPVAACRATGEASTVGAPHGPVTRAHSADIRDREPPLMEGGRPRITGATARPRLRPLWSRGHPRPLCGCCAISTLQSETFEKSPTLRHSARWSARAAHTSQPSTGTGSSLGPVSTGAADMVVLGAVTEAALARARRARPRPLSGARRIVATRPERP
jgi:hypothetical protein